VLFNTKVWRIAVAFPFKKKNMKRNERPASAMEADSGNSNVRGFAHIPLSKALE
jgi:hypothetical protein